jgi:hypothetical protein
LSEQARRKPGLFQLGPGSYHQYDLPPAFLEEEFDFDLERAQRGQGAAGLHPSSL